MNLREQKQVSIVSALSAISNEKALLLFNTIAQSEEGKCGTGIAITKLGLTCKRFYSIVTKLLDAGLINKTTGKYRLTSFGRVVFSAQEKIESGIENYWILDAIDSLMKCRDRIELPAEEYKTIIHTLITNNEIKKCINALQGIFC